MKGFREWDDPDHGHMSSIEPCVWQRLYLACEQDVAAAHDICATLTASEITWDDVDRAYDALYIPKAFRQ